MAITYVTSPSYPSLSLDKAVEFVKKIESNYRMTPVDREDGANLLGYSSLSGPANKTLAALASYGLVERAGKGMMKVTELGSSLSNPLNGIELKQSLLQAADKPPLYRQIREHFDGLKVPPMAGIETFLNRIGFNPNSVSKAAKAFYSTMEMIEQIEEGESHGISDGEPIESEVLADETGCGGAALGDYIQWENQGVLKFTKPMKVRWVSDDGTLLAIEGSDTGIPMEQVTVQKPAKNTPQPQTPPVEIPSEIPNAGQRKAVFPVSEGDVIFVFPEGMSLDGIEELEAYLAVFLKKEKRLAKS